MSEMKDITQESYQRHAHNFDEYASGGTKQHLADSWFRSDTILAQTIQKRNRIIDPLLSAYVQSTWLTVGDGRFGADAGYIKLKGHKTMATDIAEPLLKEGAAKGLIDDYKVENAENLSFADATYDFVLCKEAYHHFPRPMKAFYEMLRVARKGVVLLEPPDQYIYTSPGQLLLRSLVRVINVTGVAKLLLGTDVKKHTWEDVGNYVYKISEREVEKVALGLNYPAVAFRNISIWLSSGIEELPANSKAWGARKFRFMTRLFELLTFLKLMQPALLSVIIFKESPTHEAINNLEKDGYRVHLLPRNPHIKL